MAVLCCQCSHWAAAKITFVHDAAVAADDAAAVGVTILRHLPCGSVAVSTTGGIAITTAVAEVPVSATKRILWSGPAAEAEAEAAAGAASSAVAAAVALAAAAAAAAAEAEAAAVAEAACIPLN